MTQRRKRQASWEPTATEVVAQRIRELRIRRGWSAQALADQCAKVGVDLVRDVITNIENGRRAYVSIDEVIGLAYVLGVAPVDLFVPVESKVEHHKLGEVAVTGYRVTPTRLVTPLSAVRRFVVGGGPLAGMDKRTYASERPDEDNLPTAEDVLAYLRKIGPATLSGTGTLTAGSPDAGPAGHEGGDQR